MKVSIIVAAYNEELLISKCLNSLLNQIITDDYEIIVVDDGSIDNTYEICKELSLINPKILKVFKKDNEGQGLARNFGISKSIGEYIGFVDADDYVDENMLKEMYHVAKSNNSEVVICDVHKIYEETGVETKEHSLSNSQDIIDIGNYIAYGLNNAYSCNKLFKRNIWEKYQFKKMVYEDLDIIPSILSYCKKVSYIQKPFYKYFKHKGTTTTNYSHPRLLDIINAYDDMLKYSNEKFKKEIEFCVAKRLLINLKTDGFKYHYADLIDFLHENVSIFKNNILINNDKTVKEIFDYKKSNIPLNLITSDENIVSEWKKQNKNLNIILCDDILNVKLNKLYENGGLLLIDNLIPLTPFGFIRTLNNFIFIHENKVMIASNKKNNIILDLISMISKDNNKINLIKFLENKFDLYHKFKFAQFM